MNPEKVTIEWVKTGDLCAPEHAEFAAWVTINSEHEIKVRFFASDNYGLINPVRGLMILQQAITDEFSGSDNKIKGVTHEAI